MTQINPHPDSHTLMFRHYLSIAHYIYLCALQGKYVVLFFYPLDFTFVCPTEITAFSDRYEEFSQINCEVLGVSVDSKFSHLAWTQTDRWPLPTKGVWQAASSTSLAANSLTTARALLLCATSAACYLVPRPF